LLFFFGAIMVFVLEASSNPNLWMDLPPGLFVLCLAIVGRYQQGSWLAPGAFFCLAWFLLVWIPLLVAPEVQVSAWALWWIWSSMVFAYLGTVIGIALGKGRQPARVEPSPPFAWPGLPLSIVIFTAIGFVAVFLLLRVEGIAFGVFFSLDRIAQVGRELSVARYTYGLAEPLDERLLTTGTYLAALLGGLLLANRRRWLGRGLAFLPFIPATAMALVLTTKASILFTIVLMAGSYLAARVAITHGHEPLFPWKRVAGVTVTVFALVPVFFFTQLSRYGYSASNATQVYEVVGRLRLFFLGYLGAFSSWFRDVGLASDRLSWGAYSFAGEFDWLGIHQRSQGIYSDMVYLGPQGIPSNVYTIFRGLIEDYGSVGALIAIAILGFVGGFAYSRLQEGRQGFIPLLCAFYSITFCSFTVNLFTYDTLLLAWLLFTFYVVVARRMRHTARKGGQG
jgi:oligosaccharide repeat unit polymerase